MVAAPASARLAEAHPLAGQAVEVSILGAADWHASALVRTMASDFVGYAKEQFNYDVTMRYEEAPAATLYEKAVSAFAEKSASFNVLIADGQWLGAFASQKWILPLNPILDAHRELDIEWYAPQVRESYQLFPDDSNNRWGLPQSGDVLALYVRRDWLTAAGESGAFKAKYGVELPQSWGDFESLSWDDFANVLEFFHRPADGVHAFVSPLSAGPALSFLLGRGGQLWEARSGQVEGVLNTEENARALEQYAALAKYQPEGTAGVAEVTAMFSGGRVFSALQWVGAGMAMIPEAMRGQVMVAPPPGFRGADGVLARKYIIGGQFWALNDRNDEAQTRAAVDFLKWWYLPTTAAAFAKQGGMPCDKTSLTSAGFDELQPWLRTYRYMLSRSGDFWHDPHFAELLAVQQAGLALYTSGKVASAKQALDLIACRQQQLLFQTGSAERRPGDTCPPQR